MTTSIRKYCGVLRENGVLALLLSLYSAYITGVTAVFVYLELSQVRFRWVLDSAKVAPCHCPVCDINGQDLKAQLW